VISRTKMSNINNNGNGDYDYSSSTILTSKFGYTSAKLIHTVEKNLYIVLAVILCIATLSILNTLGVLNQLYSENVDYYVDIILSVVMIAVVAPLVVLILKSRSVLDKWNDMFEVNTITSSFNIAMSSRSKDQVLKALPYSISEIADPLSAYIDTKKTDLSEFFDVKISNDLSFDVVVDKNVVSIDDSPIAKDLRQILLDYGSIVVKIIDDSIDKKTAELFVDSLSKYISLTKNKVGLGLIIGEETTRDAQVFSNKTSYFRSKKIDNLLLLAKPSVPDDLK
jgi:hypothetical protein